MNQTDTTYQPPFPTLVATGVLTLWVGLLSLPMLSGNFVAAALNDQVSTGYAFRAWAAEQWKTLGHYPLWNPELLGGLPFVAGMHGDLFYPTAFLRLVMPIHAAMNLGFFIHYILVGLFAYLFLRMIRVSWAGSLVGGVAYQLAGVVGSYVSPGHDGKLFVTALLPLGFIALTMAIRNRRWEGYALFALTVGLSLLSPHPQMAQYFLVAAGIYALYLALGDPSKNPALERLIPLGIALAAVAVGVGISAIQYLPFYAYIPFSPRDVARVDGLAWSASYGVPWEHLPEFFLSRFVGESFNGTYWSANGIKLHSEYLGLPVVGLAILGALAPERRRMIWWLAGIGALLFLVSLGTETPFFQLWWSVVPFVKSTRAPGMAMFAVAFIVAVLAGFGVHRLEQGAGRKHVLGWMIAGASVVVLAMAGAFGAVADSMALAIQMATGFPRADAATLGAASIRMGAAMSGLALGLVGAAGWAAHNHKLEARFAVLAIVMIVGTDLWLNQRPYWRYSRSHQELFGRDAIKDHLMAQSEPFRVWDAGGRVAGRQVYPQSALMADGIAQWFGHHGNELHAFDELHGREGVGLSFANEGHPQLMDLYAIRYIIVPQGLDSLPGFRPVVSNVPVASATSYGVAGAAASLFERLDPVPYARLVPTAAKVPRDQAIATVLDSRFPLNRIVLLELDAAVETPPVPDTLPEPLSDVQVTFDAWEPGYMRMTIDGGAPRDAFLLVSENHYPDWRATVDGAAAQTLRANGAVISVPVAAGSREIELQYVSEEFGVGKTVTFASLFLVLAGIVVPPVLRRRKRD